MAGSRHESPKHRSFSTVEIEIGEPCEDEDVGMFNSPPPLSAAHRSFPFEEMSTKVWFHWFLCPFSSCSPDSPGCHNDLPTIR